MQAPHRLYWKLPASSPEPGLRPEVTSCMLSVYVCKYVHRHTHIDKVPMLPHSIYRQLSFEPQWSIVANWVLAIINCN